MAEFNEDDKRKIEANNRYWAKRANKIQQELTNKSVEETEKQLIKYYQKSMRTVIADFEDTYDKLLATIDKGREPSPADLYKLDRYWKLQGELRQKLMKLGNKQATLLSREFEKHYFNIYNSISLPSQKAYSTLDDNAVKQMINQIWCADGKSWSQRVWNNIDKLQQALNDKLVNSVITGKKTTELKKLLQERFNISYRCADTLVRTELAHIQTEAAKKRYEDYGIQYIEVLVDVDDRTCDKCKALIGKKFPIHAAPPLPVHPNERCAIIPVID